MIRDDNGRNCLFYLLYRAWKDKEGSDLLTVKHADVANHMLSNSEYGCNAAQPDLFGVTPLHIIDHIIKKWKPKLKTLIKKVDADRQQKFRELMATIDTKTYQKEIRKPPGKDKK